MNGGVNSQFFWTPTNAIGGESGGGAGKTGIMLRGRRRTVLRGVGLRSKNDKPLGYRWGIGIQIGDGAQQRIQGVTVAKPTKNKKKRKYAEGNRGLGSMWEGVKS